MKSLRTHRLSATRVKTLGFFALIFTLNDVAATSSHIATRLVA